MEKIRGWLLNNKYIKKINNALSKNKYTDWLKRAFINNTYGMLVLWFIGARLLCFAIEFMQYKDFDETMNFFNNNPEVIRVNVLILMTVTAISFLFKRKYFVYTIISFVLIGLGAANSMLLNTKGEPLTYFDIFLLKEAIEVSSRYINKEMIISVIAIVIFVISTLVIIWKLVKKQRFFSGWIVYILIFITILSTPLSIKAAKDNGIIEDKFWDLISNYKSNGFTYSFYSTVKASKRKQPSNYNEKSILKLKDRVLAQEQVSSKDAVDANIIMVQLESFYDPLRLADVKFSKDPIPTFRELSKNYSSGEVKVSTYGGGTVKSEFEFLTGLSIDCFSPGEVPYNTVLRKQAVESMPSILRNYGLKSHAVHNFEGTFYGRDEVYKNIGFDTFVPIEYMNNYGNTPLGWIKDDILVRYIDQALESTEKNDFVYVVTNQCHGGYDYDGEYDKLITVEGDLDETEHKQLEYYCTQLYETDQFIKSLIEYLENRGEPTVVIFVPDHLPSLNVINNKVSNEDKYIVDYVTWNNIGLDKEDENIESYQVSTKLLNSIGVTNGIMQNIHNTFKNDDNYIEELNLMQYDILFGKHYYLEKQYPFTSINTTLGIDKINVKNKYIKNGDLVIEGNNFTEFSKVFVKNKMYDTVLINENEIRVLNFDGDVDEVKVNQIARQAGRNNKILAGCD